MSTGLEETPVCLLTGAGGRLGSAFLRSYSREMKFFGVYRSRIPDVQSNLAHIVHPHSDARDENVYLLQADLADPDFAKRATELAIARFGRIDHIVNAGADVTFYGQVIDADRLIDKFAAQMKVNYLAPALLAARVAREFWRDRPHENRKYRRSILNVSSISGLNIYPDVGQANYSASKAALNFLTCHTAAEFADFGVRANALAPTSFPQLISEAAVISSIHDILESEETGKIYVLDENGIRKIN